MTMTIFELENILKQEKIEDIIGISDDGCRPEIRQLSDLEEIVDYHGKTRQIKMRYKLYPEQGRDQWSFLKGPVFEIVHFCVSPQNFGYGTKFMIHLMKHFEGEGIKIIVLKAKNLRAERFWRRLGFVPHPLANDEEMLMYRVIDFDRGHNIIPIRTNIYSFDRDNKNYVVHH